MGKFINSFRVTIVLFIYLISSNLVLVHAQEFIHPGILNSIEELEFIKEKVNSNEQPWKGAFDKLKTSNYSSLSYKPKPFVAVMCGSYNKPNVGCNEHVEDGIAAYSHALLWYITNDQRYADKAIEILNAWSSTYERNTDSNARLVVSWATPWYVNAAEIIRYTNTAWKSSDIETFNGMLDKFLPYVLDETMPGNNWIQSAIEAHFAIAVFQNNRSEFNKAVERWKFRVKTYIYQTTDGPKPINQPGKSDSQVASIWRQSTSGTVYVDGLAMETCRDLGHLNLGFKSMMYAAETAWNQHVDLFAIEEDRLSDFMELHGSWMTGAVSVPSNICDGKVVVKQGDANGIKVPSGGGETAWEIAYNHLHYRLNMNLPFTSEMINSNRPVTASRWVQKWETLTHGELPFNLEQAKQTPFKEKIKLNGFIEAEHYDIGVEGSAFHDLDSINRGGFFRNDGVDIDSIENGYAVSLSSDEWLEYSIEIPQEGEYKFDFYYSTDSLNAKIGVDLYPPLYGIGKELFTEFQLPKTDSISTFQKVSIDKIVLPRGEFKLRLNVENMSIKLDRFNINLITPYQTAYDGIITIPGSIQTENYDTGGEGISYHDVDSINKGAYFRTDGVDIDSIKGGSAISSTSEGEWLEYSINISSDGEYDFEFIYSSNALDSKVGVDLMNDSTHLFTDFGLPQTAGLNDYKLATKSGVLLFKGENVLRLNVVNNGFNLDRFDVKLVKAYQVPFSGSIHLPGTIEAENYDIGGEGVAYHDITAGNTGIVYREEDVDIGAISNGFIVGWTATGEWMEYSINVGDTTKFDLDLVYSSGKAGASIGLELLEPSKTILSSFSLPQTASWDSYKTITKKGIDITTGEHVLRVKVVTLGFNLDKLVFRPYEEPSMVNYLSSNESLYVFPNPTCDGLFTLSENCTWEVFNAVGVKLIVGAGKNLNLSSYPKGLYLLKSNNTCLKLMIE